jgi:AAA domain
MTLQFSDEIPEVPTINVALVGSPKSGKTMGAASAPGPILYLNCDLPNATRRAKQTYPGKIHEVKLEKQPDRTTNIMAALDDIARASFAGEYGTVVLDTIGDLYKLVLEAQSARAVRASLPQRGDTSVYLARFCEALCEAPINAVFICHDMPVKDEAAETTTILPFTGTNNPNFGRKLLGMVDVIGYSGEVQGEDGPEWVAQLTNEKGRPGGGRFSVLRGEKGYRRMNLTEWVDVIHEYEKTITQDKGKVN